jgi:Concanavalin A-like lectin/glucanases superfamily
MSSFRLCPLAGSPGRSPRRASGFAPLFVLLLGSLLFTGCGGAGGGSASNPIPRLGSQSKLEASASKPASAQSVVAANYDSTILADAPVAFYRLNDSTGVVSDATANALDGSYGSAVQLGASGLTSMNYTAAAFPGGDFDSSRIASVLPNAQLRPTVVSVDAWVAPSALNSSNRYQPMVEYGRFSTGTAYQLTITPINQFFFSVHTAAGSPSTVAKTTSSPGHIYHIVGTYDGSSLKLYVNGVLEGQASASGTIAYVGEYSWSGLAIGSGYDALTTHPIENYAGTIGDVSIYNYALTPAQVLNHYLLGVKTPPITETPASADGFVDSIGVNASFNYQGSVYDTQFNAVASLLVASGIRHIRAGVSQNWPTYNARLNQLGQAGIHSELVTMGTETASQLQSYPSLVSQSIEAYEGPNEPDLSGNPNWLANTETFMQLLQTAVKGNAATAKLAIIGPSVVSPAGEAAFGNISTDLDYGNIHPYYGTNNPGNTGTGSLTPFGRSGSIAYFMGEAGQVSGTKPIFATETGYGTDPAIAGNVSELCEGKEAPRTYFEHFRHGIVRTLPYQFVQQGTAYGALGFFSYMGFLRQDLSPKPSYSAMTALIGLLSDKGSTFSTAPLTYTLGGNVNNLDHLLMEKRNGTYYLAMWIEVPSWSAVTNADLTAPPQSVTIALPTTVNTGSLYSLGDTGSMTSSTVAMSRGFVTVPVSDRATVLAFHP